MNEELCKIKKIGKKKCLLIHFFNANFTITKKILRNREELLCTRNFEKLRPSGNQLKESSKNRTCNQIFNFESAITDGRSFRKLGKKSVGKKCEKGSC